MKADQIYITINQLDEYNGLSNIKVGDTLILNKDLENYYDDEAMHMSLQAFCRQQHISSRLGNIIELVLEELLSAILNSSGTQPDSEISLTLKAPEEASEADLLIEYPALSCDPLSDIQDPFSRRILDAYTTCVQAEGSGKAEYYIHAREVMQKNA